MATGDPSGRKVRLTAVIPGAAQHDSDALQNRDLVQDRTEIPCAPQHSVPDGGQRFIVAEAVPNPAIGEPTYAYFGPI